MRHDNIRFTLPNGATFSIVSLDGRCEVAIISEDEFVPLAEWYGAYEGDVLPIDNFAVSLSRVLEVAVAWGERRKVSSFRFGYKSLRADQRQ